MPIPNMPMHINIKPHDALTMAERSLLNELNAAVYPPELVALRSDRAVRWSPPAAHALVWEEGRLVSHAGGLRRQISLDGRGVEVGGISGVMTLPHWRSRGHARAGLAAMSDHLVVNAPPAFLLLFCMSDLTEYYRRLGWKPLSGKVLVDQCGATVEFMNQPMVRDAAMIAPAKGLLDLRGRPW